MTVKRLLTIPTDSDILRRMCRVVSEVDPDLGKKIVQDLEDTLASLPKDLNAAGLAAPQIGYSYRVFILRQPTCQLTMINPVIVKAGESRSVEEGCLSLPGQTYRLNRPSTIKIRGQLPDGGMRTFKAEGLLAQIIMHEIDHLDGILIDQKGTLCPKKR